VDIGLFASPTYALPDDLKDLRELPFIADDREALILPALQKAGMALPRQIVLRCDDPLAQITHIQAGLGVGFCQANLAGRLGLRRVLPHLTYAMPAWLVMHEDQSRIARIRFVFDHLKAELGTWM
jgi:DNA-binding transcriptional LysR family regulator